MSIVFETYPEEYNAKSFFEQYKDKLPQIILVTQGYMGNGLETFDLGQAIRIHTYTIQRKILARISKSEDLHVVPDRDITIPADCGVKVNVLKSGKLKSKRPVPLRDVIDQNSLPAKVQFVDLEGQSTVLRRTTQDNRLLILNILRVYDDTYLLGNPFCDDKLYKYVAAVPLYLPDLKFSIVKSIKGYILEEYKLFLQRTDEFVRENIVFDESLGDQEMSIYANNMAIEDTMYLIVTPSATLPTEKPKVPPRTRRTETKTEKPLNLTCESKSETVDCVYDIIDNTDEVENSKQLKTIHPETKRYLKPLPSVPPIPPRPTLEVTAIRKDKSMVPVQPVTANVQGISRPPSVQFSGRVEAEGTVNVNVESLTVEDVSEMLKKLKMDKYVNVFLDNHVDGFLLKEMNEQMMREEFGMKAFDILKLTKFAKFGYLPKTRGSD